MGLELDPLHIYVNILGLVIFPVVAKPLIQSIFSISEERITVFYKLRKTKFPIFIANALKGYEKDKSVD